MLNSVVVAIYWPVIHPKTIDKHRVDGPYLKVVCQYCVHSVPAIVCVINSLMTRTVLHRSIIKPIIGVASAYLFVNFCATKIQGTPMYDFLHWESMETAVIAGGILFTFTMVYFGFCLIDEKIKYKLVQRRDELVNEAKGGKKDM